VKSGGRPSNPPKRNRPAAGAKSQNNSFLLCFKPTPKSPQPMHVLQLTSELNPFSKTGGLADMVAALSKSLAAQEFRLLSSRLFIEVRDS
jgi:hypothetical protein